MPSRELEWMSFNKLLHCVRYTAYHREAIPCNGEFFKHTVVSESVLKDTVTIIHDYNNNYYYVIMTPLCFMK